MLMMFEERGAIIGEATEAMVVEIEVVEVEVVEAKVVADEEVMVDALEELVPKEGAMSSITEEAIPSGVMGVDDALTT